jgi:hypothetical protein
MCVCVCARVRMYKQLHVQSGIQHVQQLTDYGYGRVSELTWLRRFTRKST